jgi:hypothetical protein
MVFDMPAEVYPAMRLLRANSHPLMLPFAFPCLYLAKVWNVWSSKHKAMAGDLPSPGDDKKERPQKADNQLTDTDPRGFPFDRRMKDTPQCLDPLDQVGEEKERRQN